MHRRERGLPSDFGISVPPAAVKRTPVKLEDYLEREINGGPAAPPLQRPRPEPVVTATRYHPETDLEPTALAPVRARAVPPPAQMPQNAPTFPQRFRPRPAPAKAPRVQINLTPEVQRMVQELVGHFCTFGLQKDTSASEVFEGLISALHEAKDQLDLSNVPPRGQWGTPTARAFRTNLKNAVLEAISRHCHRLVT